MADEQENGGVLPDGLARFRPDAEPAPVVKRSGRKAVKRRTQEKELEQALAAALSPEEIPLLLQQCLQWAIEWKSSRIVMEVIKLRLAYGIGTPVQRSININSKLEDVLERVNEMDDDEFDGIIDVLGGSG